MILLSIILLGGLLKKRGVGLTDALSRAVCLSILVLYSMTEILSACHAVDYMSLMAIWGILNAVLLILNVRSFSRKEMQYGVVDCFAAVKNPILILFIVFAGGFILLALNTVPYNWDSMSYHLSRIVHWAQNGSVAHYATNDLRRLTSPPLAEFVGLHIYILYGHHDELINLVQCSAYLFNAVLIGGISEKIGVTRKMSYMSSFLYLCMPIAFSEALSTQVDEFAAMWLLIFVYYGFPDRFHFIHVEHKDSW